MADTARHLKQILNNTVIPHLSCFSNNWVTSIYTTDAAVHDDQALREKTAKLWAELNQAPITPNCGGCLLGIICLACGMESAFKLGGVTIHSIIVNETGMTTDQVISTLVVWTILSAADTVLAWFAGKYFKNELTAGTPFTRAGAKELLRLGILTITLSLGSYIAAEIVNGILSAFLSNTWDVHVNQDGAVIRGVMFIVLSIVLKYGAELEGKKENEA